VKATGGLLPENLEAADPNAAASVVGSAPVAPSAIGNRARSDLKLGPYDRALFFLMLATVHLLSLLPDFALYALGVVAGRLAYRLDSRHVRIGLKNLEIAFPEKSAGERRRILRESYINLGRTGAEYVRLAGFFYRGLLRKVRYEGLELWEEMERLHPGRGVLILSAHFGNFELLAAAHAMHGHQTSLVHHTQRFLPGEALMTFVRQRAGVGIIRKYAAARPVLRALKQGQMVGIPFDQNAKRSQALFVPFFGELAATTSGLARLARKSGAAVVPVFIIRDPNNRTHRILIQGEIPLQRTSDAQADMLDNTRRFVAAIEEIVRQYPEQFLWIHRRYRTRPRGAPKIYR
jgi:KDO2-lipid IV(A) lauroyltransferase